ncbi:MAG: hypothetical protein MJA27_15960 [Pseudanabaenales cyanobacterium]|nr:hypothetical protein [Pseudanabaenales cyanobacterium]
MDVLPYFSGNGGVASKFPQGISRGDREHSEDNNADGDQRRNSSQQATDEVAGD